jgi:hypothetical protein
MKGSEKSRKFVERRGTFTEICYEQGTRFSGTGGYPVAAAITVW